MYAQVLLLNGFEKPFWYKVPARLSTAMHEGCLVSVPLQKRYEAALVTNLFDALPAGTTFAIKEISDLGPFPGDQHYHAFVQTIARFYFLQPIYFYQRIRHFLKERHNVVQDVDVVPGAVVNNASYDTISLTDEQQAVVDYLSPLITTPRFAPTLLHGVTGSGKTEVYKRLIRDAIAQKKTALLMLPEVTLAMQFELLLKQQMPEVVIISFHSATKLTEKRELWQRLMKQEPFLIIGVHLPIVLPIANLGLIIIDEEHERGFQEKKHPKMNSKEIALWRAQRYGIPILLGSATPCLNSLYNVKYHGWRQFSITKRFAGVLPAIQKVILTQDKMRRKAFWVSRSLEAAIWDRLAKKEQIIIFLNRRGYSFFMQCKECGFIFQCPSCSVSLTLHIGAAPGSKSLLRCHYCDYHTPMPYACAGCKAPESALIKKGIGTQQVVQLFQELFPLAVIERADLDSTSKKRSWKKTVELFKAGKIDMLIGTQTITKGYHFPKVTLVGVLWADLNLHFPFYNAGEIALQQIIQVAGRAGRDCAGGKVIVQAVKDHPIFDYLDEQRYLTFCENEMVMREESFYPPFARLAMLEFKYTDVGQIDVDAQAVATALHQLNDQTGEHVTILGPAYPVVHRIQNYEIRHIVLKAATFKQLHQLLSAAQKVAIMSDMFIVSSQ